MRKPSLLTAILLKTVYFYCFNQGYLVFGSDLGFRSQMLRFSRNIASTARSYSGKTFTHIKSICKTK